MITKEMWEDKFVDGELSRRYFEICSTSISDSEEGENHHILPRSIFPEYEKCLWNIVRLSHVSHYEAHEILASICANKVDEFKMIHAWNLMCNTRDGLVIDADTYNSLKIKRASMLSENMSGELNPMYGVSGENAPCFGRTGERHPMFGKKHHEETKEQIRKSCSGENNYWYGKKGDEHPAFGRVLSPEAKADLLKYNVGKVLSDETKEKIRKSRLGIIKHSEETKELLRRINTGRIFSEESKEKLRSSLAKWTYVQYSMDGRLLNVFRTTNDLRNGGFNPRTIRNFFNGSTNKYAGFLWRRLPKLLDEDAVRLFLLDESNQKYVDTRKHIDQQTNKNV